jgi:hypothetical protein
MFVACATHLSPTIPILQHVGDPAKAPSEINVRGLRWTQYLLLIPIMQQVSNPAKAPSEINVRGLREITLC